MKVLAEDEIDDRKDEEFIHDQLSLEPTDLAKGIIIHYHLIMYILLHCSSFSNAVSSP